MVTMAFLVKIVVQICFQPGHFLGEVGGGGAKLESSQF